jgi:peroxiredoxin
MSQLFKKTQQMFSQDDQAEYKRFETELTQSQALQRHLTVGDKIPSFSLPDAYGQSRSLESLHTSEWLIITFYRGAWCPFCNLELRSLQRHLRAFKQVPANLIAISPQRPDHSMESVEKNQLTFPVLSDVGNKVASQFRLAYKVPAYMHELYKRYGIELEYFNGDGELYLPLAGTFIVDRNNVVQKEFVSAHAHERLDPKKVTDFLQAQKQQAPASDLVTS